MEKPDWTIRRRIIIVTLLYCAVMVGYIVITGSDTAVASNVVVSCFGLVGSVVGFYVAGAAWDDKNYMQNQLPPPQVNDEFIG